MRYDSLRHSLRTILVTALITSVGCANSPTKSEEGPAAAQGAPRRPDAGPATNQTAPPRSDAVVDAAEAAAIEAADAEARAEAEKAASAPGILGVRWTGDLDGMLKRRVIRVLTTYSKVNYFVDQGQPRGLIYDSLRLFEDDLNKKLKTKNIRVHVVFIPVAHDELIPALLDGRGDIVASGTLLTEWRREQVDFSHPTRTNVSSIIVTGPGVPPVATPMDLGGREVYLQKSDVSRQGIDSFNAELAKAGHPPVKILPAPEVLSAEDMLEMVNAGLVPATLVDDYLAEFWKGVFPNLVLNRGAAVRTNQQTGMLVRKNSPQLLNEVNGFLARYPAGSTQRNILFAQYLKNLKFARDATSEAERQKFERTVELFRKYSDRYKIDYLLMAAQGYQESRLDQGAKSHVGAIGVMQVMPATGKELAVGNITELEPNIHAGVKYVRFMMDRYFEKEPMSRLDKGLFTFASYNAGPARIRELRALAGKRGLNSNVWFNNVEVIAGERIGRETVQYVSNIYKYYLAYTLLVEQRAQRQKAAAELKKGS
jgi:membrane-bound lytic murein transglycosylase MltF